MLAAVDIISRAGKSRIGHDVRSDIRGRHDTSYGKRGAKLIAPAIEFLAEERCRQLGVDESGSDEIDKGGRKFERKAGRKCGKRGGACRHNPQFDAWVTRCHP